MLTGLRHVDFGFPDPVTVSIKMNSLLKMRWGWENKQWYIRPRSVLRMSDGQVARRVRSGEGVVAFTAEVLALAAWQARLSCAPHTPGREMSNSEGRERPGQYTHWEE